MSSSTERVRERLRRARTASLAEVEWFYTCAKGGVPDVTEATVADREAAAKIQGWLGRLATFHVGALSLRFTPREWPASLTTYFGRTASLVVRLDCAAHPSQGYAPTGELEAAAVQRIEKMLAGRGNPAALLRLERHALEHVEAAITAYIEVRGLGPSVLPMAPTTQGEGR